MTYFLMNADGTALLPLTCSFDSKTGESLGYFKYRTVPVANDDVSLPADLNVWQTYGTVVEVTEDIGDMMRSNYLIIKDRNHADENGNIVQYDPTKPNGREFSHYIQHNFGTEISNLLLEYKNMYL